MDGPPVATAGFHSSGGDAMAGPGGIETWSQGFHAIVRQGVDEKSSGETKVARAIAGMAGGVGEFSYTRNSQMQSLSINILKPILEQEIREQKFHDWEGSIRMADFGCSVGTNTLQYAEICYRSVQERWRQGSRDGRKSPDVQYFFCDLPSNDFNTLFRQLEDWRNSRRSHSGVGEVNDGVEFYAAAVPGSFFGRLFPQGSLHGTISVHSVQWMSQVPDVVVDKSSPAYNKGRVWIDRNKNSAALEAFAQTARQDLRNFLQARADEVVSGGFVLFYCAARADESHPEIQWPEEAGYAGPYSTVFEATWEELVVDGVIEEERRDSFNVPVYCHSLKEVRAVAESTNAFHIKRLELKRQSFFPPNEVEKILANPEEYGRFTRNFTQSLLNGFIVEHIGEENTRELFSRLERNTVTAAREKKMFTLPIDCVLAVLIRK